MKIKLKVTTLGLIFSLLPACAPVTHQPFDSKKWLDGNRTTRARMAIDIQDHKLFAGKTKIEVEQLLGKPDKLNNTMWTYWIATVPKCHVFPCNMSVYFDEHTGKVKGVGSSY